MAAVAKSEELVAAGERNGEEKKPEGALAKFGSWYDSQMRLRPLWTKTWTAFVMSGISNSVAQSLDGRMNLRMLLSFSLQAAPPYSHFWFSMLDRQVGDRPGLKTVLDQLFWRPTLILYTFVSSGLLSGAKWAAVKDNLRKNLKTAIVNSWKVWPAVMFVNQKYVPILYQSSMMDLVSFFWDIYMSLLQAKAAKAS